MVIPRTSRCTRPLKRSTRPLVCGVYGLVLRCSTFSWRQASSKASAVKHEPRSVSTCVTLKGKAPIASFRKATALVVSSSSLTARCTKPRAAVDRHIQKALAALAIGGLQLRQVLDVHVHEAEVVVLEGPALPFALLCRRQAAEPLRLEDAVDRIAVEMRQEVRDDEGQIIEGEAGGQAQGTDDGTLFLGGFPGQLVRPAGVVRAVLGPAFAPLADGLGAHTEALGQDARGLGRAGNLLANGRGGAGL